jgi:predicted nucleotidyltransferase
MSGIDRLEASSGAAWTNIRRARHRARERSKTLHQALSSLAPNDTSIVVFGSLAREELTEGSDIDWTLLIDGQANPQHFDASLSIERALTDDLGADLPGREGTFGGLAFSHDILHKIGGTDDSNRNTTQRILLLLESAAIGNADAHRRLIRGVLKRYISEDFGWMHRTTSVPRFLQNDIARYWRTVAVDFAYKRRQRSGSGWALRTLKLRMSRKLTYATGLLVCFAPALGYLDHALDSAHPSDRALPLVDLLSNLLHMTPLERLAHFSQQLKGIQGAVADMFGAYDEFLGMLDDSGIRAHLNGLTPDLAGSDPTYERAREMGHRFQRALDLAFFDSEGTGIPALTRRYGVF